ncbi:MULTISPECIES: hypothetical protein [unclassified Brenneria]|uniref:hypothetical protein n=1 Tax=unclassified Brenneria TaxID=2634434 RepID=UPI001552F9B8|nr:MULTISPECIES: hypothetical protein [unclassified Brenneria]MBJ7223648.1 hypothetical protein [Brenneria sp. L3-3C-1]MEE3644890.1 hypothetical protein [Brenneria sp. L3_3C_1]MEE3652360.1 hypothetical protein [Brenneria sp. HEZEL_4_2_4]NPD02317.1 hypothetical protein [Brenneria sp. hezel4-2-4]
MNSKHNKDFRFKPDFFELVAISELVSYENLYFLPFSHILLNTDIVLSENESIDFSCREKKLTLATATDTKILHTQTDILCIFSPYFIPPPGNENEKVIVVRRLPCTKRIFYNKQDKEWCFFLEGQCYNSKIETYGNWREGSSENLYRVMKGFLYTRNNEHYKVRNA